MVDHTTRSWFRSAWPWLVILLTTLPAFWHVLVFPDELDPEFPRVDRPTFNRMPPPAYRLAEPGDTLDRVAIYLSATAVILGGIGWIRSRSKGGLWPAAIALALAGLWHASTPGPTFDGWHGLGWRSVLDPATPGWERLLIALGGITLAGVIVINLIRSRQAIWDRAGSSRIKTLLAVATTLVIARQFEIPGVEPVGYWPRWAMIWGLVAFDLALVRALAGQGLPSIRGRLAWTVGAAAVWTGLVVLGVTLSWFHRPLERLHEIESGKLYISAMPTYQGLKIAHDRHHFKTIINVFPEDTPQRSPILPDEHRFVREQGIRYIEASAYDNDSDEFLDMCLGIAQDPDSWPILLHCHGCMDRSPAWMGIYRFVVQGKPLDSIFKEIEAHRGYRPKASVTLLYNRVLEPRAPTAYGADPTAKLLQDSAHGITVGPSTYKRSLTINRPGKATSQPETTVK